jgi:hypothetical protein
MHVVNGMRSALENIRYITFHIDAELDEQFLPSSERLPSRREIRDLMSQHIDTLPPNTRLRLHYLQNKVHLELFFSSQAESKLLASEQITRQLEHYPWFGSVKVWVAGQ